jgi:poly(hydroxyalkanoate) granule-associated protein
MTKHKSNVRAKRPARRAAPARNAAARLRQTWDATVAALTGAEAGAEKQIRLLLKKNRARTEEATAALKGLTTRIQKERKKAVKQLESRLATLQSRLAREGRTVGRAVDEAVHGALATLNIPSRREVSELTHKVDELSRKIDGLRRPGSARKRSVRPRSAMGAVATVPVQG